MLTCVLVESARYKNPSTTVLIVDGFVKTNITYPYTQMFNKPGVVPGASAIYLSVEYKLVHFPATHKLYLE